MLWCVDQIYCEMDGFIVASGVCIGRCICIEETRELYGYGCTAIKACIFYVYEVLWTRSMYKVFDVLYSS